MHTFRKENNDTYDVVFVGPGQYRATVLALIKGVTFEEAIWYVNILNGGDGKFDKEKY